MRKREADAVLDGSVVPGFVDLLQPTLILCLSNSSPQTR